MVADLTRHRIWKHRGGELVLGRRTLLMGVVNITPDSFSDGGRYLSRDAAVDRALRLQDDGADILDLGAESTRPGSKGVPDDEQLRRLLPVLEALNARITIPISVDTSSTAVARRCLETGASVINDISGFHRDPDLPRVCAEFEAGIVLMHIQGTPETMQHDPHYDDLFEDIRNYLLNGLLCATNAGISIDHVVSDPGIGFGKTFEQNYQLLGGLSRFSDLSAGILVGPSRKAFTAEFNKLPPEQRQFSTAAAVALAVLNGADIVRVHDVWEMRQVVDILDRYRELQRSDEHGISDS